MAMTKELHTAEPLFLISSEISRPADFPLLNCGLLLFITCVEREEIM